MAYICNVKGLEEVEKMNSWKMNVLCIVNQDHRRSIIAVDHSSKIKSS